jgi:DNA-binding NarL/FixJ family response regulator
LLFREETGLSTHWADATNLRLTKLAEAIQQVTKDATCEQPDPTAASLNVSVDLLREKLSGRQLQVFNLLLRGMQTKDIARHLSLSPRTVEVHRAKILERLQFNSFSQLLRQLLAQSDPH